MSFAALKNNRTDLTKLVEAASSGPGETKTDNRNDERFWQPTRDKAGNGYAVIRFLPGDAEAPTPWVRYWDHFFKGPTGQWYVEKSLTSIGKADPLSESNSKLWNEDGSEEAKRIVRERKRNLRYIANVLIISDPSAPENEGEVKLYRFGKKIFDKIMDSMQPQFPDERPVNPFDMWQGADFTVKIRKVEGWVNYDKSEFDSPTELSSDDTHLEGLYNSMHPISEFTDEKFYKSYADLEKKLNDVLGQEPTMSIQDSVSLGQESPAQVMRETPPQSIDEMVSTDTDTSSDDQEDTMSYFARLANAE